MITKELIERVRDVGIVLYTCKNYDQKLGRLQLQKLIYLLDTLVLCRYLLSVKQGHETYHHGPYDQKIQNAVDLLGFWGLVDITDINVQDGKISSNYEISTYGEEWINELINKGEGIYQRFELSRAICDSLSRRNAFNRIRKLVYAEPTYSRIGQKGYGYNLDLSEYDTNLSSQVVAKMEKIYKTDRISVSDKFVADFLIEFLEQRASVNYEHDDWIDN
ncbi:hypothetical protein MKY48_05410 [Paenibacillus sp. FSL W8-0187]|uniref:hypothetical protein n=1 Tax=Paenibacillus sp. FSL W8-0187 TaxID=2921710 RepID=UPI0030DD9732